MSNDLGTLKKEELLHFLFWTHFVQEIILFLVFKMALAAILDFEGQDYPILGNHLELYGQDSPKIQQIPFFSDLKPQN